MTADRAFQVTGARGLDHSLLPMTLWRKAKKLGTWDPLDIDLEQDRRDWQALSAAEHEVLLHLTSLFAAGEESVTVDLLPLIGVIAQEGRLKKDESRHIAYGVFLLSRLTAEHGDPVWEAIQRRMGELMPLAIGTIGEIFDAYQEMPFGLELESFVSFASAQFESRLARLERARGQSLESVLRGTRE